MYKMLPGKFVVVEGPDNSGKTSACAELQKIMGRALFTHQPRGDHKLSHKIYKLVEEHWQEMTPLALQFLHLASHDVHYTKTVQPALSKGGVVMDRSWISTLAYGYFGTELQKHIPFNDFFKTVLWPAKGLWPDIVFYCRHVYRSDKHNTPQVVAGYDRLYRDLPHYTQMQWLVVPPHYSTDAKAGWMAEQMKERGLCIT